MVQNDTHKNLMKVSPWLSLISQSVEFESGNLFRAVFKYDDLPRRSKEVKETKEVKEAKEVKEKK